MENPSRFLSQQKSMPTLLLDRPGKTNEVAQSLAPRTNDFTSHLLTPRTRINKVVTEKNLKTYYKYEPQPKSQRIPSVMEINRMVNTPAGAKRSNRTHGSSTDRPTSREGCKRPQTALSRAKSGLSSKRWFPPDSRIQLQQNVVNTRYGNIPQNHNSVDIVFPGRVDKNQGITKTEEFSATNAFKRTNQTPKKYVAKPNFPEAHPEYFPTPTDHRRK